MKIVEKVRFMNKKKSVAGRLFYTFGTIFAAAVLVVCAMNFVRDARVLQGSLLSAMTVYSDDQNVAGTEKTSTDYETIQYKKSETKPSSEAKSNTASKPSSGSKAKDTAKPGTQEKPVVPEP